MQQQGSILIVDDDEDILVAGKLLLKRHFSAVQVCNNPQQIPRLLADNRFDAILLDMNFGPGESSGAQGYGWLEKILAIEPRAVVVMITAHGGVDVAVEAMKRGATDFIAKPWHNEKVVATVSAAVKLGRSRAEADELRNTNKLLLQGSAGQGSQPLLGDSAAMAMVKSLIERCAPTDANVLILGENGTGKELVARAIHDQSKRHNSVFMSVDLGAVAESLFESELFGYKKGAFTGANEDRIGRLQAANGGTLFLDEVGNLPLHLQAKLLTVLEQRLVTPVGASKPVPIDVRVIAATNVDKHALLSEQRFRQDLLFRLNTVEIPLPPLRQRVDDIPLLAQHYIALYARKYGKPDKPLSSAAIQAMQHYAWPGNVRALRHAIERAIILSQGAMLEASDLQLDNPLSSAPLSGVMPGTVPENVQSSDVRAGEDLNLERLERNAIAQGLKKHHYNISHAAKELGLTRAALYRRMEKYGL